MANRRRLAVRSEKMPYWERKIMRNKKKRMDFSRRRRQISDPNRLFDNEILNVKQAAEFLQVCDKTIYEKSKSGLIPHQRIGSKYVFLRSELVRFLKGD